MVVMNRHDYIKKARALLDDTNTYKPITTDPTTKLKNRLINILKMMKGEGNIDENTYRKIYSTGASAPKFYGLPKIHKEDVPLRPIVSSIGSVTYGVTKELSRILKPLVGNSSHHVNNSQEFAEEIRNIKLERGECLTSFDITALYTSIPVADTIEVIKRRLEQDTELPRRTTWSSDYILKLLEFSLVNTYFLFNGQFFEQTKGAAMGSPVSPIVANIYMEAFEDRALNTALHPPKIWKRYVDDTFVIQLESQREEFFHHINQVDTSIKFTMEEAGPNGSIPLLDLLITPEADGTLTTKVYRKPTHIDQYLQWDSNHNLASKYSVINTFTHRAKTLCSTPDSIKQELEHLEIVLMGCKYPRWSIQKILPKQIHSQEKTNKKKQHPSTQKKICHMVVPYSKGIAESFKNICRKYGKQVYFKEGKTIKTY